ncbi:DoxX family protein [Coxiella burnetii]|uniref:DoxX family protein n=1 Tax=Coxiella burnetii TaxID=777 RepID=UPI00051F1ABD|nr:DoxX family protein [Coxiella burnetii]AIT63686.1 DoxD-like family [Coxiella burnetii str. Namibia]
MIKHYYSGMITASLLLAFLTLIIVIINFFNIPIASSVFIFSLIWTVAAILFLIMTYKSPQVGFLLSVFCILTVIRILGVNGLYIAVAPACLAFLILIILFFYIAYQNVHYFETSQQFSYGIPNRISAFEWHLTFIRMYIGYDLFAHFAEKLFAGPVSFQGDVKAFLRLGITNPDFLVRLAGLCELGGAIAIGLGFLTRLGSLGITLYLIIATVLGNHFQKGFIWANPGGGWEYPVMWAVLLLSFCVLGAGKYSIDASLQQKFELPQWLQKLMGAPLPQSKT